MTADGIAGLHRVDTRRRTKGTEASADGPGDGSSRGDGTGSDIDLLAAYGRHRLLGWEIAGEASPSTDWFARLERWHRPLLAGGAAAEGAVRQLNDLGTRHGAWVAVGAWKVLLEFSTTGEPAIVGHPALVACVRAYDEFGVTNLAVYIPPVEMPAYEELTGHRPPMDGFFGAPVFTTSAGPKKADFLNAAARAAESRSPVRLRHATGVEPRGLDDIDMVVLWDFARLVLLGPLLVNVERRNEQAILARLREAVGGTDHGLVAAHLRARLASDPDPAWFAAGAARFCEEYLDVSQTNSADHLAILDEGLAFLVRFGLDDGNLSPSCLSPAEVTRLDRLPRSAHVTAQWTAKRRAMVFSRMSAKLTANCLQPGARGVSGYGRSRE